MTAITRMTRGAALLLILIATESGCRSESAQRERRELPAVSVRTVQVEQQRHRSFEDVVGTVRSKQRATISAKVSGRVGRMNAVTGQEVPAGAVLVELEAPEIQAKLDQALAVERQTEGDLKRATALVSQHAMTQQDFDAAQARASVAKAAVHEAETMLSYTKITAPFAGVVAQKLADVGDLAAPGRPLLELVSPNALRFEAEVPEAAVGSIRVGDVLPVTTASVAAPINGTVSEMSPAADPASRTLLIILDLPKTEGLLNGQFGRVRVPVGSEMSLRLPSSAVIRRGQLEFVYVVMHQHANLRLVRTGRMFPETAEILSGLDDGDRVVLEAAAVQADQQPVTVQE